MPLIKAKDGKMLKSIPYGRQTIDINDIRAVIEVLKSDWLTQGPTVAEFEKALAAYCGSKYAVAVSNGTAALHIACIASGLGRGDEAITTPMTFAATANSILYSGAKPVFADVDPATANISIDDIKRKITKRTKAILPVDYAGVPCDIAEIFKIAKKNKLAVIQDGCHALGAEYRERDRWVKVGSCEHSDMTVFSFHPVKSITTGEGGAVLTNSRKFYEKLLELRTHGITRDEKKLICGGNSNGGWYAEMQSLGLNYRITDFQCALGIAQLGKLDGFISKRRVIAEEYSRKFASNPYFDIPVRDHRKRSAWHLYPIRMSDAHAGSRKEVFEELRSRGIGVQVHYIPVYLHPYYRGLGYKPGLCPNAERFYAGEISLPIYPLMKKTETARVIKTVMDIFKRRGK